MKKEQQIGEEEFRHLMKKYKLVFEGDGYRDKSHLQAGLTNLFKALGGTSPRDQSEARDLMAVAEFVAKNLVPPEILRQWQDENIRYFIESGERKIPVHGWHYEEPLYRDHPRWDEAKRYITFWEDWRDWKDVRYGTENYHDKMMEPNS